MILTLPALMLACGLHSDQPLLLAVVQTFSRGNPYMTRNVRLAVLDQQDEPLSRTAATSEREARRAVSAILAAKGSPVLGLLPARPAWAEALGRSATQLLKPCENIAISSAYLSAFDHDCRHTGAQLHLPARRACTLARYGKALGLPALDQVVLAALATGPLDSAGRFAVASASFAALGLPYPSLASVNNALAGQLEE